MIRNLPYNNIEIDELNINQIQLILSCSHFLAQTNKIMSRRKAKINDPILNRRNQIRLYNISMASIPNPQFQLLLSLCVLLCLLMHPSHCQTYATNPTRLASVSEFCPRPRSQLVVEAKAKVNTDYDPYARMTNSELGDYNWNKLVQNLIDGKFEAAYVQARDSTRLILYFIFFAIGLVVLFFTGIILGLCCLCRRSCPPKCCTQDPSVPYTKAQIRWPACMVLLLGLIITGTMTAAIIFYNQAEKSVKEVQCSLAIVYDDLLNGNVTTDGTSFFVGVSTLESLMQKFDNTLSSTVTYSISNTDSGSDTMIDVNDQIDRARQSATNVPNGSGGSLVLSYNTPFDQNITNGTIDSTFPSVLGDISTPNSLLGVVNQGLTTLKQQISLIEQPANKVFAQKNAYQNGLNATLREIRTQKDSLTRSEVTASANFKSGKDQYLAPISLASYIVIGVGIGLGFFLSLSAVLVFCGKYSCRKFMYVVCFFLWFFGIAVFLLSILYSFTTAGTYAACSYFKFGLSSSENFQSAFSVILGESAARQVSICLSTSSGNIVGDIFQKDVFNYVNYVKTIVQEVDKYIDASPNYIKAYQATYENVLPVCRSYQLSQILDFDSAPNLAILERISTASSYNCSQPGFTSDSWVPSNNQNPTYVSCKIVGGAKADNTTCTDFANRVPGCVGCFDTHLMFRGNSSSFNVLAALTERYSALDCLQFNNELSNVWNNFYKIKRDKLEPLSTRADNLSRASIIVRDKIADLLVPIYRQVKTYFRNNSTEITHPQFGFIGGLNCRVVGQDAQFAVNSLCNNLMKNSFLLRVMTIAAGFAVLLTVFCVFCVGIRSARADTMAKFIEDQAQPNLSYQNQYFYKPGSAEQLQNNGHMLPYLR